MIMETLQKYKEYAESQGLIVYAIGLKGSQNYNLSDEESDIDANLVFIPTLQQIRTGEKFKFTFPEGEVTCHNIYAFAEIVAKGNPQWIEVCHSEWHIGSFDLFKHYELNPSALKGMFMEKVHAFDKLYLSTANDIAKYGYSPKQVHHLVRLYDTLKAKVKVLKYTGTRRTWLMELKRGWFPKDAAIVIMDEYTKLLEGIYESRKLKYTPQEVNYDLLDSIVLKRLVTDFSFLKD